MNAYKIILEQTDLQINLVNVLKSSIILDADFACNIINFFIKI